MCRRSCRCLPAVAVAGQKGLAALRDSTVLCRGRGQTSRTVFSIMGRVGNAPLLLAPLGPSATLGPLDEGTWALVESTQEALVAPRLPGASELAFAADITWPIEVGRGLRRACGRHSLSFRRPADRVTRGLHGARG